MTEFCPIAWKQLFRSSWKTFDTKYQVILSNLSRHKTLVESQASLVDYEQSKLARLATQNGFERIAKGEQSQRLIAVIEKIHPPNTISDHEQAVEVRQEHPGTGRWILEVGRVKKWMDSSTTDVPLLWVNGIPGAGMLYDYVGCGRFKLSLTTHRQDSNCFLDHRRIENEMLSHGHLLLLQV